MSYHTIYADTFLFFIQHDAAEKAKKLKTE